MNLQELIKKILREEYDSKKIRLSNFILARFDEIFDKLKLERTDDDVYQYDWFYEDRDFVKVFERNHWGRFWIYDCALYEELLIIPRSIGMSFEEFQSILISYLNNRYESEFKYKPLKDIGNENCVNDDFFFQELDETEINRKINESKDNIDLNKLSKVLNSFMKNQYYWWKEITISEIKSATISQVGEPIKNIRICGKLIVDDDWLYRQIKYYDYSSRGSSEITLGDVVGEVEAKELREDLRSFFNSIFKIWNKTIIRYGSFDCIYVDSEPDQDITNQMEINEIKYTDPNFDVEWGEAERYVQHPNPDKRITWTKDKWLEKVKNGRVVSFSEIEDDLENFSSIEDFEHLVPEKIERFIKSFSNNVIELPIAVKLPNGKYDLIAGNTRLTGLRKNKIDPKIWVFNI